MENKITISVCVKKDLRLYPSSTIKGLPEFTGENYVQHYSDIDFSRMDEVFVDVKIGENHFLWTVNTATGYLSPLVNKKYEEQVIKPKPFIPRSLLPGIEFDGKRGTKSSDRNWFPAEYVQENLLPITEIFNNKNNIFVNEKVSPMQMVSRLGTLPTEFELVAVMFNPKNLPYFMVRQYMRGGRFPSGGIAQISAPTAHYYLLGPGYRKFGTKNVRDFFNTIDIKDENILHVFQEELQQNKRMVETKQGPVPVYVHSFLTKTCSKFPEPVQNEYLDRVFGGASKVNSDGEGK